MAALTDYLFTYAGAEVWDKPQNVVVFDFGGGTCDVFVARLSPAATGAAFAIETRSVSRYHRLGGGDFDAAIIHNVLIPQLLKENELAPRHFEWTDRKKIIEPALRGCAEALKEGLCREISQLHLHGRYESTDKTQIVARQAPTKVTVGGRDYLLAHPELSAAQWEEILKPFLDREMMHARETDYVLALSIFAPLTDALERAKLRTKDVDLVLLAGGSSLVPQVQWAIERFFTQNPLINVSNPGAVRVEIEEIEEDLRDAGGLNARHRDKLTRLAELYRELRMVEKAVEVLKSASRAVGRPDAEILNRLGMFYDELGDLNRMEAHYAEAVRVSGSWAGPLFNWSLHHKRRRNFPVALEKVDEGILRQPDVAPYYILRARILEGMGQTAAAKEAAQEGFRHFPPVEVQTPWQLGWFEDGAELLGRADDVKLARKTRERRGGKDTGTKAGENELPVVSQP